MILAGGQGTRIGGEKGLQRLQGRPLLAWVLDAIRHQSDEIMISANAEHNKYAEFGFPVIADHTSGWAGPLAGLQAAMLYARNDLVVSVPCDAPYLPNDLIVRLYRAISIANAEAAVAVVEGKRQPVIALYRRAVLPKLNAYLNEGQRKVGGWLETLQVIDVVFDEAVAFININSSDELVVANHINTNNL